MYCASHLFTAICYLKAKEVVSHLSFFTPHSIQQGNVVLDNFQFHRSPQFGGQDLFTNAL